MAKKENNKRSYDLNRKWQERKKKRNSVKKQLWNDSTKQWDKVIVDSHE